MTKHKGVRPAMSLPAAAAKSDPALWGYGFGATLIGLGLLVLSIALGSALRSATRGMRRLAVPGDHTVSLQEGLYVGILPAPAKGPPPDPRDVQVAIRDEAGAAVPQVPFPPEMSQANRKIGATLFQAQILYDGRYTVQARAPEGAPPAEVLLIHESMSRNPADVLVGVILMAVLGGFGTYILVLTRRRRSARAA